MKLLGTQYHHVLQRRKIHQVHLPHRTNHRKLLSNMAHIASPSPAETAAELLRRQRTLFKGFSRYTNNFKVEEIKVKWELEDRYA